MNNEQFRKLLGASSAKSKSQSNGPAPASSSPAVAAALGSRQRANIPMTPRSVGGGRNEFARQLAARNQEAQPQKKFRTAAPKGSRFAEGYVDRAKQRKEEEAERTQKIQELEVALKEGEIDKETFEKLRDEVTNGERPGTHTITAQDLTLEESTEEAPLEEDVDDAFDKIGETEVKAVEKETTKKRGQLAPAALAPGRKRTRDQILAEMKAAREAAKAQKDAGLGDRFKKIGVKQKAGSRIERDSKGREVLIIVDEDGHEKRKVRKGRPEIEEEERKEFIPDKDAKPLGMEVPEFYRNQQQVVEEEDDDIFADAGDDYNPLEGMDDSSDEDSEGEVEDKKDATKDAEATKQEADTMSMPPPPKPAMAAARNYFKDSKTDLISSQTLKAPSMSDPAIMAAFKRAAQLRAAKEKDDDEDDDDDDDEAKARAARHKKMLQMNDRDAEDLDMGFGTSRFEDEADFDDQPIKLSEWGNEDDDEGKGGKTKRKRGPKKRKGDANNAADVLRVMEQRKAAADKA